MRTLTGILAITLLSGCVCLPEGNKGEGVDTSYPGGCYEAVKNGPRNQTWFPKP